MAIPIDTSRSGAAKAPALPTVTRRSLLRASPALLAPSFLASQALASTDTSILRLFRESDAAGAEVNDRDRPIDDEEFDRAVEHIHALQERIESEPITCLADLAAKFMVSTVYGDFPAEKALFAEIEAVLARGAA
jgi:hypothetical protein